MRRGCADRVALEARCQLKHQGSLGADAYGDRNQVEATDGRALLFPVPRVSLPLPGPLERNEAAEVVR